MCGKASPHSVPFRNPGVDRCRRNQEYADWGEYFSCFRCDLKPRDASTPRRMLLACLLTSFVPVMFQSLSRANA